MCAAVKTKLRRRGKGAAAGSNLLIGRNGTRFAQKGEEHFIRQVTRQRRLPELQLRTRPGQRNRESSAIYGISDNPNKQDARPNPASDTSAAATRAPATYSARSMEPRGVGTYGTHKASDEIDVDSTGTSNRRYHSVPSEESYWITAEDLCVPLAATVMARNRFWQLKRFFHVVDNTQLKAGEKMGKIQPFYDEISKCFHQFRVFHESLRIDESMVPYYGHHSCKMSIRGKPIRFGYKIWMMCSSNG
ncbi:hypothetical protein HPB49_012215 [Dermacentor silvarum]|uniref:Uncharacterized protein n=1 Tax=Dermacentor silvarum TaxID=543639 RepID=A0ACB8C3F9_DERSI|nr:hypothetical protein HPB49_012215 [Dermacentor silvarum]